MNQLSAHREITESSSVTAVFLTKIADTQKKHLNLALCVLKTMLSASQSS